MARRSAGESALHRHLRILDAFDALHPYRSLAELADASGLAKSTAHGLLAELEREGLVERLPDRSYRLGVRLWEFASRTPGALGLRELARPWMNAVQTRVRQHTQLAVLSRHEALFIERLSAPDAVVNATIIGGRTPLPLSSSGLVLLAHAGEALFAEVVEAGWPRPTASSIPDAAELRRRIRAVRAEGSAVLDGHIYEESRGIAVPVFGPHGVVYAALGVVVPNDAASPQASIELLTVAAAAITRSLEEAYLPDDPSGAHPRTLGPLVSTSKASLDYFAALGETAPRRR